MEIWFVYALLSGLFAGLYSFFLKVSAEKNHNSSLVTTYSMFVCSAMGLFFFLFNTTNLNLLLLLFVVSFANAFLYFIAIVTRIESLKNIDTTIYFPISKTIGPVLMVFIGILFFSEKLIFFEFVGIMIGVVVPLLLIHKKENSNQKNMKKGLILLGIGIVFGVLSSSMSKVIVVNNLNILLFLFVSFFFGGLFSLFNYRRSKKKKVNRSDNIKLIGILNGVILFFSAYFFTNSTIGNLGVVYTINSFSILVPIILSIIIYKENFNTRKGLAIALTIVSLYFLQ